MSSSGSSDDDAAAGAAVRGRYALVAASCDTVHVTSGLNDGAPSNKLGGPRACAGKKAKAGKPRTLSSSARSGYRVASRAPMTIAAPSALSRFCISSRCGRSARHCSHDGDENMTSVASDDDGSRNRLPSTSSNAERERIGAVAASMVVAAANAAAARVIARGRRDERFRSKDTPRQDTHLTRPTSTPPAKPQAGERQTSAHQVASPYHRQQQRPHPPRRPHPPHRTRHQQQ